MLATNIQPLHRTAELARSRKAPLPRGPAWAAGQPSPQLDELQRRYRQTLQLLAETRDHAERAEHRLRSRLVELTWPAALSGIVGGFVAIVGLRLAGL